MNKPISAADRRTERSKLAGDVIVEIPESRVVGPGQNISSDGVFFIAEGSVPVKVRIEGSDEVHSGEIVRLESMGDGRFGFAVRFVPPPP